MDSFLADGGVSKWASLYPSGDVSRQYTDDDYLGQIFDNTWDSSYSHKQKKSKPSSTKSSKGAASVPATPPTANFNFAPTHDALGRPTQGPIPGDEDKNKIEEKSYKPGYEPGGKEYEKIVKKTKNKSKEEIEKVAKEEEAKLPKKEKDKLKKIKTGSKDNYKGLPPEAYVIDQTLGYPLMRWLFGELAFEDDETDAERNNKESKVPKDVIAMNKSRERV